MRSRRASLSHSFTLYGNKSCMVRGKSPAWVGPSLSQGRVYQWYMTLPYTNAPWKPNGELDEYGNAPF
jgi:hypothetical protein